MKPFTSPTYMYTKAASFAERFYTSLIYSFNCIAVISRDFIHYSCQRYIFLGVFFLFTRTRKNYQLVQMLSTRGLRPHLHDVKFENVKNYTVLV